MSKKYIGIFPCLLIGIGAWSFAEFVPIARHIGGPIIAMLLGILFARVERPELLEVGIRFSGKKILQYSIVFIGFGMNIQTILETGSQSLIVILFTVSAALLTAFFIGKALKVGKNTSILVGVGTAICGGSAIAATAPVIEAEDREVVYSISTIFLFNIVAAFLFPYMGRLLGMSDTNFGMWAGTAINDTSSVVAAGYSFSTAAGDYATIVKLTRVLLIIPITLALAFWRTQEVKKAGGEGKSISLLKIFPYFVIGFLLTALINSTGFFPEEVASFLNSFGRFGIMVAMAGIGLNTHLRSLFRNGLKPIYLGLICWSIVVGVSLLVQNIIGM